MNVPPCLRAQSQLKSAVRAPPMCRYPVGEGANRTRGLSMRAEPTIARLPRMRRPLALPSSSLALLAASPAAAATFVATSVEEAARSAEAVVRGRVLSSVARLTRDGRGVVTEVEIAVASAWKGAPDATVRVVVPGGSVGTLALWVDAAPTFEAGEEVVVFLAGRGAAVERSTGLALGKYRVEGREARPGARARPRAPARARRRRAGGRADAGRRARAAGEGGAVSAASSPSRWRRSSRRRRRPRTSGRPTRGRGRRSPGPSRPFRTT